MASAASTVFVLLAAAGCILLAAAQNLDHCGSRQIPSDLPDFRAHVKTVVGLLAEKNQTGGSQVSFSRSPDDAVNSASGAAICYTRVVKDCKECLKLSAEKLAECNTTVGAFSGDGCNMQFWRTFD